MKKVMYKKFWGVFILVCAAFILGVNIVFGFSLNAVTGVLLAIIGSLYLGMPVVVYNEEKIQLKNLFGITTRTYLVKEHSITLKSDLVYIDGQRLRVPVFQLNKEQYQSFIGSIAA